MPNEGIGAEYPLNDRIQIVFILFFFIVWILDSFMLRITALSNGVISILITVLIGVVFLIMGVYLIRTSHSVVFKPEEIKIIDTGVYGWVRHPMYLGELLFLLGLAITTFSLLSVVVWAAFFVFLDRMATFEEKELTRIMGQQYVDYRKRVRKWIPF